MLVGRIQFDADVIRECRLAIGSVGPTATRLKTLEDWLNGQRLSPEVMKQLHVRIEADISPMDDIRSTAEYRKWVSGNLVQQMLCSFST
jgi:CO/xanthine dehydrogenase FAD-binding subunit